MHIRKNILSGTGTGFLFTLVAVSVLACCEKPVPIDPWTIDPESYEKVVIHYAAGHNSLSYDIREDMEELAQSSIEYMDPTKDALVIFSHLKGRDQRLHLIKVRKQQGEVQFDTLRTLPAETISASGETAKEALEYIRDKFPAEEYNMIFSSHATGYLPVGYYLDFNDYEQDFTPAATGISKMMKSRKAARYVGRERRTDVPLMKSIGSDVRTTAALESISHEMEISEFAKALPMHFNAIIFDCCLMGGIECVYELKDKCDYVAVSPAEIISYGMDYDSMGKRLFGGETDLKGICKDFFDMYDKMKGEYRSATISLVDCGKLPAVAQICNTLFEKYRNEIASAKYKEIQRFYTTTYNVFPGFYDLLDIMEHSSCTEAEINALKAALDECIPYKAATESFLIDDKTNYDFGGYKIDKYCGLSMYLPAHRVTYGNACLEASYRGLAWNEATKLIK